MAFRPLAGVLLALLLTPSAVKRVRTASDPFAAAAPCSRSRRPAAAGTGDGEFVHAIAYGRRERPIGIVQA